jgi:hypothetical protein
MTQPSDETKKLLHGVDKKSVMARAEKLLNDALQLIETNTWEEVKTVDETKLSKCDMPKRCPTPCYLTETTIEKPIETLVDRLWSINEKGAKVNDPSVMDWREVVKDANYKIVEQHNKMMWPIYSRHMVFSQAKFEGKDEKNNNIVYLVAQSIDHPDIPLDENNYVRGHIHMSVYKYKQKGPTTTEIQRIAMVDPCGKIPVQLVNAFAHKQVEMFNMWKKS